ncbi:uncharacterized protein LOC144479602 [Mustelus asterias]
MQSAKPGQLPVNLGQRMGENEAPTLSSKQSLSSVSPEQCSEMQEEIMAEELLKVMNFAASKIQALWRGYCTRKQLHIEQGAATLLQAFWRGYQVRKLLREPVSRPLQIHVQPPISWMQSQEEKRLSQAGQVHIQSRQRSQLQPVQLPIQKGPRWTSSLQRRILAATIIQAYWRGYLVRRDLAIKTGAAIFIQSFFRGYLARRNLKANAKPSPIPQDEEAKMVAYNMSFSPSYFETQTPISGSPPQTSSSFQSGLGAGRGSRGRVAENASLFFYTGNNDYISGKGDTVQSTKPRRLLSWCPDSGEENCPSGSMSTMQMARKGNAFVPGYFTEGAGDTTSMSSQCSAFQTRPECVSPVKEVKDKGLDQVNSGRWEKHQNVKNRDRVSQQNILGVTATRPRYSYKSPEKVGGQGGRKKSDSQFLLKCTPYSSDKVRKLIRYKEEPGSHSSLSNQPFHQAPVSKLDFDLSVLEVPRRTPSCPSKSSGRKTLKQVREESAAAGTIQAVWKGHRTRRFLRQQAAAATKIQAIYRSYRTRKEFESEGILPLVYAKEKCKYLSKGWETGSASRGSGLCEVGLEKPGDGTTRFTTASTPAESPWMGTDSRHISGESETPVQPSQRLEAEGKEQPAISFAPPASVPKAEGTRSSSPPADTPGNESKRCTHTQHWLQRIVQTRKQHQRKFKAASTLQAAWRGHHTRCCIREQREAALRIQAQFRGFRIRKLRSSIGREEDSGDSRDCASCQTPETQSADTPDYLYRTTEAVSGPIAKESPSKREARKPGEFCCQHSPTWRAQAKPDRPAIFVKRNPCYNPRKVAIHVKAAGGDMS